MYTTLLTAALMAPLALATPTRSLYPRQSIDSTTWTNPKGGNLQVGLGNQGLQFGSQKPSDIIRNNLTSACNAQSGCNGVTVTLDQATFLSGGYQSDLDVSFKATGDYNPGQFAPLQNALAAVLDAQTNTTNTRYFPNANPQSCGFSGLICTSQDAYMDQYTAPSSIRVQIPTHDNSTNASGPAYIDVEITVVKEADSGLCDEITSIGSTIAGVVGGVLDPVGDVFSLASLFCNLG